MARPRLLFRRMERNVAIVINLCSCDYSVTNSTHAYSAANANVCPPRELCSPSCLVDDGCYSNWLLVAISFPFGAKCADVANLNERLPTRNGFLLR
ncbi:hypothetical protein AVEN_42713-1 [Araneus ventricosus]|uniref:Uncharacterized protein n=1 Tax=Araneus ventricosus TaxID=182803 RepID=A0A4Y2UY97_ARAVE|nr:hypothetical protein AVEN_42713-1 [Araneus ventricosus]